MNEIIVVGAITFGGFTLDVYYDLNEPLFKASDIASIIAYSPTNTSAMLASCEEDEKLLLPMVIAGQRRNVYFVNEHGLYNILAQSRKPIARKWRRIVHDELINLRKQRGYDILRQFEEWDHRLDDLYIDEETGILMQSVTVPGGDVEQVPYKG